MKNIILDISTFNFFYNYYNFIKENLNMDTKVIYSILTDLKK